MTRKARKAQPKGRAATDGGRTKRSGQRRSTKPTTPTSKLTPKQQRFAAEYVVDYNATQAAVRAGYKDKNPSQVAYQLLQKTSVAEAIETAKKEALLRAGVRADAVLLELAKIGFSSQRHLLTSDEDGNVHLRPGNEIPDAAWDAVKSITAIDNQSESESESPNGGTRHSSSRQRTVSVVMHDKRAALVDLGRHLNLFGAEKLEVTGKNGGPLQTENVNAIPEDQRAERLAALLATAAARKAHAEE